MKKFLIALMLSVSALSSYGALATVVTGDICIPTRDAKGKIARSATQVKHFRKDHPCPITGKTTGACKGYAVDHIQPLCACGADSPSNMQWLDNTTHAAKTKVDVKNCAAIRKAAK